MAKTKYYVVWVGKKPGIYTNWTECQAQVNHYPEAKYKSFATKAEADAAYKAGWQKHWGKGAASGMEEASNTPGLSGSPQRSPAPKFSQSHRSSRPSQRSTPASDASEEIDYNSISVDVGTRGNPGPVEYKGVDTRTGDILFSRGPISRGTNNLGEFLAIVHGLAYLKKQGSSKTIYSDSLNAMKWVRQKQVATTLKRDKSTEEIWELIDRAEQWLQTNTYDNKVLKWQTDRWGEIKADYGRK